MIYVIATIEVAEGRRGDFLTEFRQIVSDVRREVGCIEYGPAIDAETDIPAQGQPRADVVTIVEKWERIEDLTAHLAAPHMLAYRQKVQDIVQRTRLQILQPA